MWEKVATRKHTPVKVFPFGPSSDEVMLYGTVDYGLKSGGKNSIDWAARAHLVKEQGTVKMDFYQVYLVSLHGASRGIRLILMCNRILLHRTSRMALCPLSSVPRRVS